MNRMVAVVAFAALSLSMAPTASAEYAATTTADGKLLLLLDSSGSMKESAGGQTKIEAAKSALTEVVQQLPDDAEVGVRVFGAKVFSANDKGACEDTQNVVPVGTLDRDRIISAVDGYKPYGETPIGNALKGAAKDLGTEGKRTIVLLSDGEPTCSPDPCKVAKDLRAQGVDLTVNVVGLSVKGKAREALQCIAKSGGGTYYDVDKPDELASSLVTTSVRAFREFSISGTPVVGGESSADPTAIEPGRYTDETRGADAPRHYLVTVPTEGGVAVTVIGRPEQKETIVETVKVRLSTPEGDLCDQGVNRRANVLRLRSITSTAAYFSPLSKGASAACLAAKTLVATVETDASNPFPYELGVTAVPEVTNVAQLPEPTKLPQGDPTVVEAATERTPVVGGAGFADAPELTSGTYTDSIRPGEQLLYKVPVGWGQSPRMSIRLETNAQADQALGVIGRTALLNTFSPFGEKLTVNTGPGVTNSANYRGSEVNVVTNDHTAAQFRNIEAGSDPLSALSYAGDFYFSLEFSEDTDSEEYAVPLTISVDVKGAETGIPTFASAPEGPSSESVTTDDDGSTPWLLFGLGAAVVALLMAAVARRRRNPTSK